MRVRRLATAVRLRSSPPSAGRTRAKKAGTRGPAASSPRHGRRRGVAIHGAGWLRQRCGDRCSPVSRPQSQRRRRAALPPCPIRGRIPTRSPGDPRYLRQYVGPRPRSPPTRAAVSPSPGSPGSDAGSASPVLRGFFPTPRARRPPGIATGGAGWPSNAAATVALHRPPAPAATVDAARVNRYRSFEECLIRPRPSWPVIRKASLDGPSDLSPLSRLSVQQAEAEAFISKHERVDWIGGPVG
jgi:hypothetical protein